MAKEKTAIAVVEKFELPALPDRDAVEEEMAGLVIDFERIKIPSGGGLAFELSGDDEDDVVLAKEIEGAIIYHHPINAYWEEEYTGQSNPPTCFAIDGKYGEGEPGGVCQDCPNNVFGSDGGNGKLCKNMRRIYLLQEGELFPLLLTLPPTSLGNFARYVSRRILQKNLRTNKVVTKVSLKKATSSGGISYSQAVFKLGGILPEDVAKGMEGYGEFVKGIASGVMVDTDDYNVSSEEEPF